MNKPTLIITGANGFIGECLVKHFYKLGWKIKALVHHLPQNKLPEVEYISYNLEEIPEDSIFASADFMVHCAYIRYEKNKNADAININGTKKLIAQCRKNNVKPIFLSSFSAHTDAESHYGITKLKCEKLFDPGTDLILKPGFVIGHKGIFGEMMNRMKRSNFFPLVGGGEQPLQTIYIDDLCSVIENALIKKQAGIYHIAEPVSVSMKYFYMELAKQLNKKIIFIPIPISLLYGVCRISEMAGLKLPVSSESTLGLKHLIAIDTKEDLKKLGVTLKNYREGLECLLK